MPDRESENLPPEPPSSFDLEGARERYRRQMRSRPMRALGVFTVVVILLSWAYAAAAAFAPSVERLPRHDVTVSRAACLGCHVRPTGSAPPMNHPATPTCGFCHVQARPPHR